MGRSWLAGLEHPEQTAIQGATRLDRPDVDDDSTLDHVVGVKIVDRERRVPQVKIDDVADLERTRLVGLVGGVLLIEAVRPEALIPDDPRIRWQRPDLRRTEGLLPE